MARSPRSPRPVRTVPRLPRRPRDTHKGSFGRVLVLTGSVGMAGAPALAALGALRSGAGLVTIAVPRSIQSVVTTLCPCATTIGLPETDAGQIAPKPSLVELVRRGLAGRNASAPPDVVIVGMGLGRGSSSYAREVWRLIDAFRVDASVPVVVDADALNLLRHEGAPGPDLWTRRTHPRTIITPHPGELARLLGTTTAKVQADRRGSALKTAHVMGGDLAAERRPVVVLKGSATLVTDARRIYENQTGNPGMATGGSGDVLAGIIGALVGQKLSLFDAAVLGTHVHGLAGDLASRQRGEVSLIATDLIEFLPAAFRKLAEPSSRKY